MAWLGTSAEPWLRSERRSPITFVSRFSREIKETRSAGRPLNGATLARMQGESAAVGMRVVVLNDPAGLPWLVAVGPYEPGTPGWKQCAFMGWTDAKAQTPPLMGRFTGEQWPEFVAEAEAGRSLERFRW
jgi:hypothetical protein